MTCVCESVFSILVGGNLDNESIFDKETFPNECTHIYVCIYILHLFVRFSEKENEKEYYKNDS